MVPALLLYAGTIPTPGTSQTPGDVAAHLTAFEREYPQAYELLHRLERAQGLVFARLAAERGDMPFAGSTRAASVGDTDLVRLLTTLVAQDGLAEQVAQDAEAGYSVLGERGARIIARGQAFQREVLAVLADPAVTDRRARLAEVVARYSTEPETALPSVPKDMDVLYDHPRTFMFRAGHPDLDGFVWAGHWMKLAATEPLTDLVTREDRAAGLDTVVSRYHSKLSRGAPPQAFPTQIPLAPAIAPGFIYLSPEAAMIWDNLSLLQEVLADILASPDVEDPRAELDGAIDFFLDPELRVTARSDWESMALQHGIFHQGGYPLALMTRSELNGDGHAAHVGEGGAPRPMPVVPN